MSAQAETTHPIFSSADMAVDTKTADTIAASASLDSKAATKLASTATKTTHDAHASAS